MARSSRRGRSPSTPRPGPGNRYWSLRLFGQSAGSGSLLTGRQPTESTLDAVTVRNRWQTARDHGRVDEAGTDKRRDEVPVLLAEGAELRDAEVFLVEAPAGELWRAGWCAPAGPDASACPAQHIGALLVRQEATHRRNFAHLDRLPIQTGENPMEPEHVAAIDQRLPAVQVASMRLALHAAPQPFEIA